MLIVTSARSLAKSVILSGLRALNMNLERFFIDFTE